jgi:hypothetical protein
MTALYYNNLSFGFEVISIPQEETLYDYHKDSCCRHQKKPAELLV